MFSVLSVKDMVTIYIDSKPYEVKPDQNLLQACLTLGFDLPYFCWHPAMHSVGACRQCAVKLFKDEKDTRGRIVMSCMTPVAEGMRLSVDDAEARSFRASVIEWLMLNHPHDCPVCDEGGECHLQDMTVMTGHVYRRKRFPKRTHRNQYLGPFVNHEMNRCIQCYRCVRFYRGIAGGRDLNVFSCHDNVYFGRHEDGALESEFSGNLVEVCPTGVFTDKTLKRHYTRKWDLQTAPSVCVHCGVGCNTIAGERYGSLRRILNRHHRDVNSYFLCDRGRFGYEFVNSEKRIRSATCLPFSASGGKPHGEESRKIGKQAAVDQITKILASAKGVIGIGSPRASLETNFLLRKLVGPENFFAGLSDTEHRLVARIVAILREGPARTPSLQDIRAADAVLVLGEDAPNTAPLLALAIRQSVRNKQFEIAAKMRLPAWDDNAVRNSGAGARSPLFVATPYATRIDDIALRAFRADPVGIARLGFAIAREIEPSAPELPLAADGTGQDIPALAREIAAFLKAAKHPVIVSGTGCLNEQVLAAAANISRALCLAGPSAQLSFVLPECNTLGSGLLGGRTLDEAFTRMQDGLADTVIIAENDLYRRAGRREVDAFFRKARHVIVLDHLRNPTVERAEIVLPAATFAESSGTLVSSEARAQRFFQVFLAEGDVQAGWEWFDDLQRSMGKQPPGSETRLDDVTALLGREFPLLAPASSAAPPASFRVAWQKIPRQSHRFSGRTAMTAGADVHEPKPADDADTALAYSMEGHEGAPPPALTPRYWSPGWNSVQALGKSPQETGEETNSGESGVRLIEPTGSAPGYIGPETIGSEDWEATVAPPRYRIFGSEELSMQAPAIAEMARRAEDIPRQATGGNASHE